MSEQRRYPHAVWTARQHPHDVREDPLHHGGWTKASPPFLDLELVLAELVDGLLVVSVNSALTSSMLIGPPDTPRAVVLAGLAHRRRSFF